MWRGGLSLMFLLTLASGAEPLGPRPPATPLLPTAVEPPAGEALEPAEPVRDWFADRPRLDGPLTREQAIALALEHSPLLAQLRQDVAGGVAALQRARARLAPLLSATAWLTWGDGPMIVGSPAGVMPRATRGVMAGAAGDANLMFMWPLFSGGRLENQRRAAADNLAATEAELAALRLEVATLVSQLVRRAELQAALLAIQQDLLAAHVERLRLSRALFDQGKIPQYQLFRDEAAEADARQQVILAERDLKLVVAELTAQLGVHPLSTPRCAPAEPGEWHLTRTAALDSAVSRRPELAALRSRLAAARATERAASGAWQPQVEVFGMADLFAGDETGREFLAGLAVGLPLLDGGERRAELREARAERGRLTAVETEVALQIARQVIDADERRLAAAANIATAEAALRAAREDYRVALERYEAGKGLQVDVLDALASRTRAETNLVAARYDLGVSLDDLRRATADPTVTGD